MIDPNLSIIVEAIAGLIRAGISLAQRLGQRDSFIAALDGALAMARARTDADLEAKHGRTP
jgi:hypothetical protein